MADQPETGRPHGGARFRDLLRWPSRLEREIAVRYLRSRRSSGQGQPDHGDRHRGGGSRGLCADRGPRGDERAAQRSAGANSSRQSAPEDPHLRERPAARQVARGRGPGEAGAGRRRRRPRGAESVGPLCRGGLRGGRQRPRVRSRHRHHGGDDAAAVADPRAISRSNPPETMSTARSCSARDWRSG